MAQLGKNLPTMGETWFDPWVGKIPWRRETVPTPVFWPVEFQGLYSPWSCKELYTIKNIIPWYSIGNVKVNFNSSSGH